MRGTDLTPVLRYLQEIGYGDLYLPAGLPGRRSPGSPAASGGDAPATAGATRGEGGRSAAAGRRARAGAPPAAEAEGPLTGPPKGLAAVVRGASLNPHDGLFGAPPSGWEEHSDLESLAEVASGCTLCPLAAGRTHVVFGSGHPQADLMFIGEGPGAQEDLQGLPFVGPAGELLTKIVEAIGRSRDEVYIANIVKCRPPGNRDPLPDEVKACRGYLERQIDLVAPKVIVALGRVAAQTLLESDMPLGRLRGRWHEVRGVAVRATYHPAALLRNASWKRPTWEDMKVVRERLES